MACDVFEWQEVASRNIVPLICRPFGGAFVGSFEQRQVGPEMSLFQVRTGSVLIERTKRQAESGLDEDLLFSVQLGSQGTIFQHDRQAEMEVGSAVLYETNHPYLIDHRKPGQHQLTARVSRAALGMSAKSVSIVAGLPITSSDSRLRIYAATVRSMWEECKNLEQDGLVDMSVIVTDMLASVLRGVSTAPRAGDQLLACLKRFIQDHATSHDLSVPALAEAHHISQRSVYAAFGARGDSPAAYLRRTRLRTASSLLKSPGENMTVGEIAAASGFSDAATFTRAFKRQFGASPSSMRDAS